MKNIFFFNIILLFGLVIGACNKRVLPSQKNNSDNLINQDSSWYLKYRIPECDSAMVFMNQVIVPTKSYPNIENEMILEREVLVRIPGENKIENYKFYVNLECLIGRNSIEVLKIFCKDETIELFEIIDKKFQQKNKYWVLSVSGTGRSFGIRFLNGKVVKATYHKIESSSK